MNYNREERTKWVWKGKESAGPFAYLAKPCAWWPWTVPLGLKSSAETLISACLLVNILLCWSRCGASKVLVLVCVDLHGWLQLYSVWVCACVCTGDICSAPLLAGPGDTGDWYRNNSQGLKRTRRRICLDAEVHQYQLPLAENTAEVCVVRAELKCPCKKLFACTCYTLCHVKKARTAKLY